MAEGAVTWVGADVIQQNVEEARVSWVGADLIVKNPTEARVSWVGVDVIMLNPGLFAGWKIDTIGIGVT
jgi:hypothetical protein